MIIAFVTHKRENFVTLPLSMSRPPCKVLKMTNSCSKMTFSGRPWVKIEF